MVEIGLGMWLIKDPLLLLLFGLSSVVTRTGAATAAVYRLTLLIWWFVLICEVVFDHTGSGVEASAGNFSAQAYGEAMMWVMAFGALAIISLQQREYLRQLFSGSYKWVALLALVCTLSSVLSPGRAYSAGWAFKLVLVVLLLQLMSSVMVNVDDVLTFLKVSLWAFFILAVVPATIAFSDPSTAFEGVGGRLNAGPDPMISETMRSRSSAEPNSITTWPRFLFILMTTRVASCSDKISSTSAIAVSLGGGLASACAVFSTLAGGPST